MTKTVAENFDINAVLQQIKVAPRLPIIVLASSLSTLNIDALACLPQNRYGNAPEDWKPFGEETIQEILLEFKNTSSEENRTFAMLFNQDKVGGFLAPVCRLFEAPQSDFCQTHWQGVSEHNNFLVHNRFKSLEKPFMPIDLEVPSKATLFRRLADIAYLELKLPEPSIGMKEFFNTNTEQIPDKLP
ncbi:MAG: hypothetical protein EAZ95_06640 [Bacteroidetes bacterium]|nr:MAG: hypothetical protein EAZ95_06640 [Bacteroidota bacterium]